ncbi:hypothetical protein AM571_CH01440 [Rhizobium etli 8C-3]|uniref:DUF6950 domain-containing protein n=1 Tax=Rhizobium etli 8C-3 TaxID=538025 RepID=A0A1L5P2B4_RHIET|nr:hypothetical protein [Rhizobium etli]APO74275.1 hypothetical protein AM571_CH01440 [Rhizobium etli 8C-3]
MNRFRIVEAALDREDAKPYLPGVSDCLFMGFAVVDDLTGSSLAKKFARAYRTLASSQRALRRRGFSSLVDAWSAELQQEPRAPAAARFGDIAIVRTADGVEHVAVCIGTRFRSKTEKGRVDFGLSDVIASFHIG